MSPPHRPIAPDRFDAVLFDLDGVLTSTARIHGKCWKTMFDDFLRRRAAARREPFQPFDIAAFELGYDEQGLRYLIDALLMDLADVGGNVKDGCHIASMGGTWMGVVYGLAGLRDYGGRFSFQPHKQVPELRFHLTVRGQLLDVEITAEGATYTLEQGDGLTIYHRDERLDLQPGEPVRRP